MTEILSIISYSFFWAITIIWHYAKVRSWDFANIILTIYFITSLTSIYFYYDVPIGREISNVTFLPFLYLFITIVICIIPLMRYSNEFKKISISVSSQQGSIIFITICILSPLILLSFIELFKLAYATNAVSLADAYTDEEFSIGNSISRIGRLGYTISHLGAYIWPVIFFYCLSNKYRKIAIIPLLAYINEILQGYISGDRVTLIRFLLFFTIIFYLCRNILSEKDRKRIIGFGLSLFIVLAIALAIITTARFEDMSKDYSIGGFITLYTGEGSIRFSQYAWGLDKTSNGDTCFSLIKDILGFDTYTNNLERRFHYQNVFNIPTYIFYTFIGDFFLDLGWLGVLLLCIIIAYILRTIILRNKKSGYLGFTQLFLLSIILQTIMFGFMYYNFKTYNDQLQLIAPFIFFPLLDLFKAHD